MRHLSYLDEAQAATADGSRSLSEWLAARLDLSLDTAKNLVRTMRRIDGRPDLKEALAVAEATFDRVEALSRIPEDVGLLEHLDVAGVCREAARRVRITSEDEFRTADQRFLVIQPSLDESWWELWGGLDGPSGALVDKSSMRLPISSPNYQTGPEAIGRGARPPPWSDCVSPMILHPHRSPYSSTLMRLPRAMASPD
jgi:hypothetical protein